MLVKKSGKRKRPSQRRSYHEGQLVHQGQDLWYSRAPVYTFGSAISLSSFRWLGGGDVTFLIIRFFHSYCLYLGDFVGTKATRFQT